MDRPEMESRPYEFFFIVTDRPAQTLSSVTSDLPLKEETDRTGSILKAGLHLGPDCGL